MPRKPLAPTADDTDYEPPTSDPREPFPVPGSVTPEPTRAEVYGEHDGEQGEHPVDRELVSAEPQPKTTSKLRRGWTAANTQIDRNSEYAATFKPDENVVYVIKFLEADPYVTFNRHWLERPSQKGGKTRIPYTCLRSEGIDKPCPLCDVMGDSPKAVTSFNIAVVERSGEASLQSFDCTPKTFRTIQNFSRDPMYSPISKRWWAIKKVKDSRGYNEFVVTPIMSDASLHDDYGYTVPSDADLAALGVYEPDIVQIRGASELMEIAKEAQAQEEFNPYGDS